MWREIGDKSDQKINKTFLYHLLKQSTLTISTDVCRMISIFILFEYATNTKLGSWVY